MKKFISNLLFVIFLLFGCNIVINKIWINTVKGIVLEDGNSTENLIKESIISGHFFLINKNNLNFEIHPLVAFIWFNDLNSKPVVAKNELKNLGVKLIDSPKVIWKVEGTTTKGKVIIVSSDLVTVRIPTTINGTYIGINTENIEVFDKQTHKIISKDILIINNLFLALTEAIGYQN